MPTARASWSGRAILLTMLWVSALGCDVRSDGQLPVDRAAFGVFYGGQVQRRDELPFQLDTGRQRQGFRIELAAPLDSATEVHWEISRPSRAASASVAQPDGRVTEMRSATMAAGQTRFEQPLTFEPGDPLGLWNIRVVVGEQVLLDRPFWVYDAQARRSAQRAARLPDAGL